MVTVKLTRIEDAAVEVLAERERITPDHLIRDLIRDAEICAVTGTLRRKRGQVSVSHNGDSDSHLQSEVKA